VQDTIRALQGLMDDDISGEIYNVGATNRISISALAEKVIELTDADSGIEFVPYEKVYEHGIEDMLHRIPSTEKIQAAIGWQAERSLEDILADVVAFESGRLRPV
jgi:UDP-glucose 4-epimerase